MIALLFLGYIFFGKSDVINLEISLVYPGNKEDEGLLNLISLDCGMKFSDFKKFDFVKPGLFSTSLMCDTIVSKTIHFQTLLYFNTSVGGMVGVSLTDEKYQSIVIQPSYLMDDKKYPYSIDTIKNVYSEKLNKTTRDIFVYLPPSYSENNLKVFENVIILNDGQELWRYADTITDQIRQGNSMEAIWIGIPQKYYTKQRYREMAFCNCNSTECVGCKEFCDPGETECIIHGETDVYLDWILDTLVPMIREKGYRISKSPKYGIFGSSFGGFEALYAAWTRKEFIYGSSQSPNVDYSCHRILGVLEKDYVSPEFFPKIYLDIGSQDITPDIMLPILKKAEDILESKGVETELKIFPNSVHTFNCWVSRFYNPIQFLLKPEPIETKNYSLSF